MIRFSPFFNATLVTLSLVPMCSEHAPRARSQSSIKFKNIVFKIHGTFHV
jgi:hypothetical protein